MGRLVFVAVVLAVIVAIVPALMCPVKTIVVAFMPLFKAVMGVVMRPVQAVMQSGMTVPVIVLRRGGFHPSHAQQPGETFTAGLFALTLNYNPTPRINPFLDMGLQAPEESNGRSSLIFDAGVAYLTSRNVQLDLSYGTGALGRGSPHPFWSAGVSARF